MNLEKIEYVYFLGIGGIGMSALARYFKRAGFAVAGYDKTPTPLTNELKEEGIHIHFEDNIQFFHDFIDSNENDDSKNNTLVVLTPAIPKDHQEYNYLLNNGYTILKRSQLLGAICKSHPTLAVAGTHGKTTTSSLVAHLLQVCDAKPLAFLGGITQNYQSNLLLPTHIKSDTPCVVEADEYDRSFLTLFPKVAAITSTDADHLDIYGDHNYMLESYQLFASQVTDSLIINKSINPTIEAKGACKKYTYSLNDSAADFYCSSKQIKNGYYYITITTPFGVLENIQFGVPGFHNVENAIAATAIVLLNGETNFEKIKQGLESFKGVKRRFDYQIRTDKKVFVDDYAHHPTELAACINSVKELYPSKKITGIFQPHLFTRTRDFLEGFAESLSLLDDVILLDIYPARELPTPGITSSLLLEKIKSLNKRLCTKEELVSIITSKNPEVLLTLGAGDIDAWVEPLRKALIENS